MGAKYVVIERETERELAEAVRVAILEGLITLGPLIRDGTVVLQVMRPL